MKRETFHYPRDLERAIDQLERECEALGKAASFGDLARLANLRERRIAQRERRMQRA